MGAGALAGAALGAGVLSGGGPAILPPVPGLLTLGRALLAQLADVLGGPVAGGHLGLFISPGYVRADMTLADLSELAVPWYGRLSGGTWGTPYLAGSSVPQSVLPSLQWTVPPGGESCVVRGWFYVDAGGFLHGAGLLAEGEPVGLVEYSGLVVRLAYQLGGGLDGGGRQ